MGFPRVCGVRVFWTRTGITVRLTSTDRKRFRGSLTTAAVSRSSSGVPGSCWPRPTGWVRRRSCAYPVSAGPPSGAGRHDSWKRACRIGCTEGSLTTLLRHSEPLLPGTVGMPFLDRDEGFLRGYQEASDSTHEHCLKVSFGPHNIVPPGICGRPRDDQGRQTPIALPYFGQEIDLKLGWRFQVQSGRVTPINCIL